MLDQLFNAKIVWTSLQERDQVLDHTFKDAWNAGQRPYLIPYGGSNTTGASAYVFAMKELTRSRFPARLDRICLLFSWYTGRAW